MATRKPHKADNPEEVVAVQGSLEIKDDSVSKLRMDAAVHMLYDYILTQYAENLPEGEEKNEATTLAKWWKGESPEERFERERLSLEIKQRMKEDKQNRAFLSKELNRMRGLPEPIFVLELSDELIAKLIGAGYDTVGKVVFGMQVKADQLIRGLDGADFDVAVPYCQEKLLRTIGELGYNLLGSRLIAQGYLQRTNFLSAVHQGFR